MKKEPSTESRIIHPGFRPEYLPAEGAILLSGVGVMLLVLAPESEWLGFLGGAAIACSAVVAWCSRRIIRKRWHDLRHEDLRKL